MWHLEPDIYIWSYAASLSLVQIMACRLISPVWTNGGILLIWPVGKNVGEIQIKRSNFHTFIIENELESIVCLVASILLRPEIVKMFGWIPQHLQTQMLNGWFQDSNLSDRSCHIIRNMITWITTNALLCRLISKQLPWKRENRILKILNKETQINFKGKFNNCKNWPKKLFGMG